MALFVSGTTWAQNVQVVLGPDEIGENQTWTITIGAKRPAEEL
jgi:hypothetical protein